MVKSSGKVGLFPCILCEPLEESDSEEKTEDLELSYPLPSKRPKSADSKIRLEDFLTAKDFS